MATKVYAFGRKQSCPIREDIHMAPLDLVASSLLPGRGRFGEPLPIRGTVSELNVEAVEKAIARIRRTWLVRHWYGSDKFRLVESDGRPEGEDVLPLARFVWCKEYDGTFEALNPALGDPADSLEVVR